MQVLTGGWRTCARRRPAPKPPSGPPKHWGGVLSQAASARTSRPRLRRKHLGRREKRRRARWSPRQAPESSLRHRRGERNDHRAISRNQPGGSCFPGRVLPSTSDDNISHAGFSVTQVGEMERHSLARPSRLHVRLPVSLAPSPGQIRRLTFRRTTLRKTTM